MKKKGLKKIPTFCAKMAFFSQYCINKFAISIKEPETVSRFLGNFSYKTTHMLREINFKVFNCYNIQFAFCDELKAYITGFVRSGTLVQPMAQMK